MTFLRHAPRHVHASVVNHITAGLTSLDWLTAGSVPFGGDPILISSTRAFIGDKLDKTTGPGTVSIVLGNELTPSLEEMGPLTSQEYPFFVDVFMNTDAEALALATDVRDLLLGRVDGFGMFVQLVNQETGDAVPGWQLELQDIERVSPDHSFPLHWHSVHATACAYFQEVVNYG